MVGFSPRFKIVTFEFDGLFDGLFYPQLYFAEENQMLAALVNN
jgi:hypothetical protein